MSNRPVQWRATHFDAMTSVIDALRVRGRVYCRTELSAPWGIAFPKDELAHFHIIETGPCWLRIDGVRQATQLETGDLALLPHGNGHVLSDSLRSRAVRLDQLIANAAASTPLSALPSITTSPPRALAASQRHGLAVLRGRGPGAEARFVCGTFSFERALRHPLFMQLPALLHIKSQQGRSQVSTAVSTPSRQTALGAPVSTPSRTLRASGAPVWLKRTLQFLWEETRAARPGTGTIVSRLTDIIFVQALRAWLDGSPAGEAAWPAALRDRRISAALDLMHGAPERDWTIASLAAEIGMSRSPFAERFRTLVGEPPLTYLTRWRMLTASAWLETSDVSIADIAERIGYQSEAAFTKAFKRQFGVSPALFRRQNAAS